MTSPIIWNVFTHNFDYAGVGGSGSGITNVIAHQSSLNEDEGIFSAVVGSTANILLTNRATAQVSTTDATPTGILSFGLGTSPAAYSLLITVTAITASGSTANYFYNAGIKTNGSSATIVGVASPVYFEDTVFNSTPESVLVLASGNTVLIQVVGVAATNIDWDCLLQYRKV